MSITIKKSFDKKLTYISLYNAYYRICKNKRNKDYILKYEIDLETNLINIMNELKNETYRQGKYKEFTIYEPKQRIIKALPFRDRIVHQWYIEEFIKPYIIPRYITDSYACIDGRGTHKAVKKLQIYMKKIQKDIGDYYILKCDIKKYFYSINKDILYKIMCRYISDKKLLRLTKKFIYDGETDIKGIPIGNFTSQYFANIYLNELDYYIKHKLKIKYYVRYMDDFILLLKDKHTCKEIYDKISIFLKEELELELNSKSKYFPSRKGVNFCGYKIFNNYILLRKNSKVKIKRKIKKWNKQYAKGILDKHKVLQSINSWKGHVKHCNSYNLQKRIFSTMNFDL